MSLRTMFGIVLIFAGVIALVYLGFTYTTAAHGAEPGLAAQAIEPEQQQEQQGAGAPGSGLWIGLLAVLAGGGLLLTTPRPRTA